jgi:streptomycin 6-kinase
VIPERFAGTVRAVWGEAGDPWLAGLPELVAELAGRWGLRVGAPYELSYHWVAPAERADGTAAVLRLGVPGSAEDEQAATALALVGGDGMCALLEHDPAAGAMLLARVEPGDLLSGLAAADDPAATAVLLDVMGRLHRRVRGGRTPLPTIAERGRAFDRLRSRHGGGTGPLPAALVAAAERAWADLGDPPAGGPLLLHGDLHHYNVLRSRRHGWLAIDPMPVLGAPLHEVGPLLLNPVHELLGWPDAAGVLSARIEQLAAGLAVPAADVRRWGQAFSALSGAWSDEDHEPVDHALACAELLG